MSEHKGCRDLVKDAMKLIDSGIHYLYSNKPRKSLESSVIVLFRSQGDKSILLCYFPQENKLSRLILSPGQIPVEPLQIVSSRDKIYFNGGGRNVLVYDSFTDCWTTLSPGFKGGQVFANEEEIYSLSDGGEGQCFQCYFQLLDGNRFPSCGQRHVRPIEKYKPESNS